MVKVRRKDRTKEGERERITNLAELVLMKPGSFRKVRLCVAPTAPTARCEQARRMMWQGRSQSLPPMPIYGGLLMFYRPNRSALSIVETGA